MIGLCLAGVVFTQPAQAHKTEVSGDVAGTWHLEPNHSPKAGEPAQVWVALTQQGGKMISLDQCDCRLAVYKAGDSETTPVLEPALEPMSPENFQSIPGAEVTFPELGEYRLVLQGSPKNEATFSSFELSYTTVVAAGSGNRAAPIDQDETAAVSTPPNELPQSQAALPQEQTATAMSARGTLWWVGALAGVSLVILVVGTVWIRQQNIEKR